MGGSQGCLHQASRPESQTSTINGKTHGFGHHSTTKELIATFPSTFSTQSCFDQRVYEDAVKIVEPPESALCGPLEMTHANINGTPRVMSFQNGEERRYYVKRLFLTPVLRQRKYGGDHPADTPHIVWYAKFADLLTTDHLGHLAFVVVYLARLKFPRYSTVSDPSVKKERTTIAILL